MSSDRTRTARRRLGVRARLTLFATSVTLGVCILVCLTLYFGMRWSLHREVDGFLEGEVQEFKAILREEDDDLKEIEREIRDEVGSRRGADLTFRLLDATGQALITSDPHDPLTRPWDLAPASSDASSSWSQSVRDPATSIAYRVCAERVHLRGTGDVIVQVAYRLDRVERSLAVCRIVCFIAVLLAAALSVIGGFAVARRSLRPVAAITDTARQISARRLSMRLPQSGANDELDDLARTLNDMLERVEQSFRQIQQFTADAAHELRTPLTALRGSAEHALAQPRSTDQLRAVIEQSLDYYHVLSRVTDDLLLLARLDAGQEPLRFESFCLRRTLEDLADLYRPLAGEGGIELTVRGGDDFAIHADPGKIRRLFSNLLDNAIKYMDTPGKIDVRLERHNGTIEVAVADTGPGIPQDDLPHVFERFYRVDRARSASRAAETRSAGLGLAICQSIVHAHRGEISIDNHAPKGTWVHVTLPGGDATTSQTAH